jgi:hypothetical protein
MRRLTETRHAEIHDSERYDCDGRGEFLVGYSLAPLFGPVDKISVLITNLVMTGPRLGAFNSV